MAPGSRQDVASSICRWIDGRLGNIGSPFETDVIEYIAILYTSTVYIVGQYLSTYRAGCQFTFLKLLSNPTQIVKKNGYTKLDFLIFFALASYTRSLIQYKKMAEKRKFRIYFFSDIFTHF